MGYQFQFNVIWRNWDLFLNGMWLTIQIAGLSTFIGLFIGMIGAGLQRTRNPIITAPIQAYIEVVRNTPFLIQLFFIFFGLSSLGLKLSAYQAALIALSFNTGAYATEIVRAGIEAIRQGQIDAGQALGLSPLQIFRLIILPQALRTVYPALTSQFILIMLGSSVISIISAQELTFNANYLQSRTFRSFEIYLTTAVLYLILSYGFRGVFRISFSWLFGKAIEEKV
jgi:polar amino acid transport system permease protein